MTETIDITGRRARTMVELGALRAKIANAGGPQEIKDSIAAWRPLPTDVVITPHGKCGTTWLQQTFHTLRTRGDMDFDDISRVVPWIETARSLGLDINAPQRASPRGFKSHLPYDQIPKGARYVVSFRDPRDAMLSIFRFVEGWHFEPGSIPPEAFLAPIIAETKPGMGYWHHLLSWWAERDNPAVLLFSYEQMTDEPEATIRRLAAFSGIPLDDELLDLTLERSSLAFMLKYKDRFDDAMMRILSEERGGLPPGSDSSKVRAGKVGGHRAELPAETIADIDARWTRDVAPATGFATYAEFEAAVRTLA
jgi:hypothetical protein